MGSGNYKGRHWRLTDRQTWNQEKKEKIEQGLQKGENPQVIPEEEKVEENSRGDASRFSKASPQKELLKKPELPGD